MRVRIIKGPKCHIGKEGVIIRPYTLKPITERVPLDTEFVRIAFDHFWKRPDGMDPVEANDNTYCFPGEWIYISETTYEEDKAHQLMLRRKAATDPNTPWHLRPWKWFK